MDISKLNIREVAGGVVLAVKVVPGSSRDRVVGLLGESLKVATSAAPEKGKANAAVVAILARAVGLDTRQVQLISSPSNPRKEFRLEGLTAPQVRARLTEL